MPEPREGVARAKPFKRVINLDIRDWVADWELLEQPKAQEGAPNVLFVVWDDTGFGAFNPFGGPIEMPTMQRLADNGLKYTQFHTTSICSPSRSDVDRPESHDSRYGVRVGGDSGLPGDEWAHPVRDGADR